MGEIVYVDLLFLINFSMDFLCFYLTARILSHKLSVSRALVASALGGIYSDIAIFIEVGRIWGLVVDMAVCAIICAVTFYRKKEINSLMMYTLVYLAVSMALGGFMTAIFNLLNRVDLPMEEGAGDGISVWNFALLAGASAVITFVGGNFFKSKSSQRIASVKISIGGKSKTLRGLFDSGNLLREPISAKPCVVCDVSVMKDILPVSIYIAAISKGRRAIENIDVSESMGMRLIPIRTAGGEGMLVAIRADEMKVDSGKGERIVDAYIALSEIKNGTDSCEALVPSELMI